MEYLFLIFAVLVVLAFVFTIQVLNHQLTEARRENKNERQDLLDRLMFIKGYTWNRPPIEDALKQDEIDEEEIKMIQEGWKEL